MDNPNRPNRVYSQKHHLARCQWQIPTLSSRPHSHPWTISDEIVTLILKTRDRLNRCAEVVWRYAVTVLGITVSLSSVRRILRRQHCFDGAREPRVKRDNPRRSVPVRPGELVETDTIHHVDPYTGRHLFYYTVIDLYSRMTHVTLATKLSPGRAANAVLDAQRAWQQCSPSFRIAMVEADNGQEYGRYFEQQMERTGIPTRHTRPNDNAHIERFNRTLQTENIGYYWRKSVPLSRQRENLSRYLDYYNHERVHLGIQLRTATEMLQGF